MNCQAHKPYPTRAAAEQALRELVAAAKRTGRGGKSWKRLTVWLCQDHFHVGRSNALPKNYAKPAAEPKPMSPGDYRRKLERLDRAFERSDDYHRRRKCAAIAKQVEADLKWLADQARLEETRRALAEDAERIAKQMTEAVVFAK